MPPLRIFLNFSANPQPKLYKRAKSPSLCNNYVLYHIGQVKADLITTNDKPKNSFSYCCSQVKADLKTMKHKYISTQSNEILTFFNQMNKDCFDYSEAITALPNSNESALKELLSDMVKRGLLMRLKKGLYYIIPYEQESETFMPDWHLIAEHLTKVTKHYIGYYSALQIHNLITQPSLKEQIVVAKQMRPSTLKIKNTSFQFIYHNEKHFFGSKKIWIDSFNKVECSDLEKTFVDCLFKPDYAGGIVEVARAIYTSKDKIKFDKLLEYTQRFKSQAVIKRLGFLLETLEIESGITKKLQKSKTASYVLLDTELPKSGKMISRWSIQQNLETETIKSAIYT
jgi:predicted transcriptional regulator of viral defense system